MREKSLAEQVKDAHEEAELAKICLLALPVSFVVLLFVRIILWATGIMP